MDDYFANRLPNEKFEKAKELQGKGEVVTKAGDAVQNAPAMKQANISIVIGSGTDVAAESANIILVNSNPKNIVPLLLFGVRVLYLYPAHPYFLNLVFLFHDRKELKK